MGVYFLLLFLLFGSNLSLAQNYIPSSADAMGLARFTSIPVSYYTGAAETQIPLAQLKGKELSTSVTLNYNTSGIKVNEIASTVGLGWHLTNAGGLITRVVRGQVDDLTNGFCTSNFSDTEPDLFFYNFMGQSGKFILDKNGVAVTIPYRNIVIKPGICKSGATGAWELIDENGLIYKFGVSSSERETTTITEKSGSSKTFVSSWMLKEVISANQTEKLQFSYIGSSYSTTSYFFRKRKDPCNDGLDDFTSTISIQTKLISSITSTIGSISFSYGYGRKDLPSAHYLSGMLVSNKENQLMKYRFEYSYFQAPGCTTQDCFRLKLDKIYDLAPDHLYSFTYNTTVNLPSRYSKNFDHWGYYNSNTVDSWLPEITQQVSTGGPASLYIHGASREPDASKSMANILETITERRGGAKQFVFEAHTSGKTGTTEVVGGVRIKSIIVNDGAGIILTRSFNYATESNPSLSSGYLHKKPKYAVYESSSRHLIFSHAHNEIFDLNGVYVGYSKVEESVSGSGKSVYHFTNFDSHPDYIDPATSVISDYSWKRGHLIQAKVFTQQNSLLSSQINEYGLEEANRRQINWEHKFYWSWSCSCGFFCSYEGELVFTYKYLTISRPVILKKQTLETYDPANASKKMVRVTDYEYDPVSYLPTKTITYDAALPAQKYITETRYVTHPDYDFCSQQLNDCVSSCEATYDPITQEPDYLNCLSGCNTQYSNCQSGNTYYSAAGAIAKLKSRHQIATPVETLFLLQDASGTRVLSTSVNVFNREGPSGSHIHLKETWTLQQSVAEGNFTKSKTTGSGSFVFDTRMRKMQTNTTFDQTTGNLLQQTSFGGIQSNYTWGHNNSLVTSTTSSGGVNSRTASATHKPLVGTLSVTDPNGRTSYTEYDVYNRPSAAKDHDGNMLSHTRYHYKGETPGFTIYTSRISGLTGDSFYFSVQDVATSVGGTPRWVWDFGDGTVLDNNSAYPSHIYSQSGNYMVKLTGLNPEYGPVTRTVQVNVYAPMSVSLCEDGAVGRDLCNLNSVYYGACTSYQDPHAPVVITTSVSNGCPGNSYYWEYRNTQYPYENTWYSLSSSTTSVTFYPPGVGNFEVRCTISDGCNNSTTASSYITRYKSDPYCPEY
jgi:hypothetical protein